ncbi:hypothetical protein FSP39_010094, partial [Pinctada imbricata]
NKPFRGSALITTLISQNPVRFRNRTAALQFAQNLFREGTIRGVFRAASFEDSDQLYVWHDENINSNFPRNMTSSSSTNRGKERSITNDDPPKITIQQIEKSEKPSLVNAFFKELEEDFPESGRSPDKSGHYATLTPWTIQRASTASSDSSADTITHSYTKYRDKSSGVRPIFSTPMATSSREHEAIPEESSIERTEGNSLEFELVSSLPRSTESSRRWHDSQHCYSDNEKQLIEEMKRLKRDHQEIVRGYEDRVNKLMTKMHELRGIAEMLENSSTKSSPYGVLPKNSLLSLIGARLDQDSRTTQEGATAFEFDPEGVVPPPLPPRPGRGNKVYPNKPIIRPSLKMKPLEWSRIILRDSGGDGSVTSIWHAMLEPKIDTEEVERLFRSLEPTGSEPVTLYDDVISRRGRTRPQLVTVMEREKSGRVAYTMKALPCSFDDVINAVTSLEVSAINSDRFAELMELFGAKEDVDKINNYVKRKSPGHLDHPEYMLLELSKMEHFRSRVDFLRFRYRMQWQLFEIDQQLRELHTACDEITNSLALKNLLETLLAVGNYLNGGSPNGQADGYSLDILNKLKDIQDKDSKGNLLDFVMKMYCQFYEVEIDIGCPTRFKLPEPSNMRHAAQVSFDSIQDTLANLLTELRSTRDKFHEEVHHTDSSQPMNTFRTTAENFFTSALEVISDEEKLLRETKDTFHKTKAYFMFDDNQCKPQEFFQVWAVFLHDCKYYWKLAHRKIAKERFEFEFKYKGQMSVNSAHGYDSFRASMLRRLTTLRGLPDHPVSSPLPTTEPVPKAISGGPSDGLEKPQVPPLPQRELVVPHSQATTAISPFTETAKAPSPMPLTSEPPLSLHKPQALSAMPNGHVPQTNYENHEDMENALTESQGDVRNVENERPPMPLPHEVPSVKTPDKSFSIKSWLKREPGKRNANAENRAMSEGKSQFADQETPQKRPGSGTTFSKIRNTVVQKITGTSSSAKRPSQLNVGHQEASDSVQKPIEVTPSFTPLRIITDNEIDPYMTSLGRTNDSQTSQLPVHFHSSSAERRNLEREGKWALGRKVVKGRNGSDISTEYAGLYHTPPFTTPVMDKDGYASPQVLAPFQVKNDINNNEKGATGSGSIDRNVNRNRAPLALGSNISISDAYGKDSSGKDQVHPHQQGNGWTPDAKIPSRVSNTVPKYKSKKVHNYENQGRFDVPNSVRQVAHPVAPTVQQMEPTTPSDTSLTALKVAQTESIPVQERSWNRTVQNARFDTIDGNSRVEDEKTSAALSVPTFQNTPVSSKSHTDRQKPLNLGRAYQRQHNQLPTGEIVNKTDRTLNKTVPPQKPPRTPQMQRAAAYRDLSQTKVLSSSKEEIDRDDLNVSRGRAGSRDDISSPALGTTEHDRSFNRSRGLSNSKENLFEQVRGKDLRRDGQNPQNISSLINRFEIRRQPKEFKKNDRYNFTPSKPVTNPTSENRAVVPLDDDDPPPLPPRSDHESINKPTSQVPHGRNTHTSYSDHHKVVPDTMQNGPRHLHPTQNAPNYTPKTPLRSTDAPYKVQTIHFREDTGASENDEGYKDQLRKAAANSSVFERYGRQQVTPQTKHNVEHSSALQHQYTPQTRTNDSVQRSRPFTQNTPFNPNSVNFQRTPNTLSTPHSQYPSHFTDKYTKDDDVVPQSLNNSNTRQKGHIQENGPTAVVQPMMVQHGSVAFMDI